MFEGMEVASAMKQFVSFANAKGRDQHVCGRSDRDAVFLQKPIISCGGDRNLAAADITELERFKVIQRTSTVCFRTETL